MQKSTAIFKSFCFRLGDADIIAEASAAMFSGKITARKILIDMGFDVEIPPEWNELVEILRSRPGKTKKIQQSEKTGLLSS